MTTLLIDHLNKLESFAGFDEAADYAELLYRRHPTFRDYINLCYNKYWKSCFDSTDDLSFIAENLPDGMHDTRLEKVYKKFVACGFEYINATSAIKQERRAALLMQIMEGISAIEQKFLTTILKGEYPLIPRDAWKRIKF